MKNRAVDYTKESKTLEHINKENWDLANEYLIKKALSEWAHERIIFPNELEEKVYQIISPDGNSIYEFEAEILSLFHWSIKQNSIKKKIKGKDSPLSLQLLLIEFRAILPITEELFPVYLEEITATLFSLAYKFYFEKNTSEKLVHKNYQEIEHSMYEGHPCFLANSGKYGFSSKDFMKYAPEANHFFSLIWVAGHKSRATFSSIKELEYEELMNQELGVDNLIFFKKILEGKGKKHEDYIFFPVHPWQWYNKISLIFAEDISNEILIELGIGEDHYLAQQSIRTLFNISQPNNCFVKTALSVVNMGFMRGLSPYYMESTPRITEWINELVLKDNYLQKKRFTLLNEIATVGYRNLLYEPLGKELAYNKMLAVLWRESPMVKLENKERCMTMASLLHKDKKGEAFVKELIRASKLSPENWIKRYLDCYLSPLIHCFYKHDLVFMPHGENLIMVMENNIPVRVFMKDITEEIIVLDPKKSLPDKVKRIQISVSNDLKSSFIWNDIFEFFFRFLSAILHEQEVLEQNKFWSLVKECFKIYAEENPELKHKMDEINLYVSHFNACCLNRLQMKNSKQMLDLNNPMESLQFHGKIDNPIA